MQLGISSYQAACPESLHSAGDCRRTVCWQLQHLVQLDPVQAAHLRCGREGASRARTPAAAAPPPAPTPALRPTRAAPPAVRHCLPLPRPRGQSCWQPRGLRQGPGWADSTRTGAPWSWRAAAWFAAGLRRSGHWLSGHGRCQRPLGCTPGQAVTGESVCCFTAAPAPHSATGLDTLRVYSMCCIVCCAA